MSTTPGRPEGTGVLGAVRSSLPILTWLPNYRLSWLSADAIAGFTLWGLLIPEMIAYASLAGLPPQAGLYTLLASLTLYAVLGTSRQLVVAGTSASAVLIFSTITALRPKDAGTYAILVAGLVILTGLAFILAGLFRLGFITSFLSRPVMAGFVFGLAVFVSVSQLPKLFGLKKGKGDTVQQFVHILANLGHTSLTTFAIGALSLVVLFSFERYLPRIPGGLVVLVLGIGLSAGLSLSHHGVKTVGKIPTGLPSVGLPHLKSTELWVLLPSALGMMLVIFSEALGAGQTFAEKHDYRLNNNREMIALGAANVGSGLLGGLAAGGSLSETAVNDGAGAKSEVSPLVAAALSLITVVALTPVFTDLPEAVLAALIIHAVSHLMNVAEMRRFYQLVPREFWLGLLTLLGVIIIDVLPGLIIGVASSFLLLVYRASRPGLSLLGRDQAVPGAFEDLSRHEGVAAIPGVLIVRPDAPLFYANAQSVQDQVEALVAGRKPEVRALILDLDANDEIDITSAERLGRLVSDLQKQNVHVGLAKLHAPAAAMARRSGLFDALPETQVFPTVASAVAWARGDRGAP